MAYETTDQLLTLPSHHWYKEHDGNLYKLLDIYNSDLEQISDSGEKVMKWRAIQDAEDTTLDLFGKDIETYRPTKDDPPYRFLIYLKTLLARAQGTIPSIFKIASTALGTTQDIKIWKTKSPRHVGIMLPWDYVNDDYIQRFLVNNLQHMLALGYWFDVIVFKTTTHLPLYVGGNAQSSWETTMRSKTIWWTGWKAKTEEKPFAGIIGRMSDTSIWKAKTTIWWSGWKAKTTPAYYVGMAERCITSSVWSTQTSYLSTTK